MQKKGNKKKHIPPVPPATYRFTAASTGRVFTGRRLSMPETTAIREEARRMEAAESGKRYSECLVALLIARSLVEPKLSVVDAFELQEKQPGYYAEIASGVGNTAMKHLEETVQQRTLQIWGVIRNGK